MSGKLSGKVALITGASSGIGEATALALASEGAQVAIVARREDKLKNLASRISAAGGESLIIVSDVSDATQAQAAINTCQKKFGRLDILVNNAGVMHLGAVDNADIKHWQQMFNVNVLGLMYCTHTAIPFMKKQNSGHIVNISSVAGRIASARSAVYSATKFAVGAFSEGLRQELAAHKIRVTVIEPGAVLTELTDNMGDALVQKQIKDWISNMEALESEDIAAAIVYAVSQAARVNVNEILIRPTEQVL